MNSASPFRARYLAVSYTHLDVYKRQQYSCLTAASNLFTSAVMTVLLLSCKSSISPLPVLARWGLIWVWIKLDVYKRQEQDRALVSLLHPERLLDLIRNFIIYDNNVKKICRYCLLYTSKTAPTEEQREQARQEYLDRRGVPESFRW